MDLICLNDLQDKHIKWLERNPIESLLDFNDIEVALWDYMRLAHEDLGVGPCSRLYTYVLQRLDYMRQDGLFRNDARLIIVKNKVEFNDNPVKTCFMRHNSNPRGYLMISDGMKDCKLSVMRSMTNIQYNKGVNCMQLRTSNSSELILTIKMSAFRRLFDAAKDGDILEDVMYVVGVGNKDERIMEKAGKISTSAPVKTKADNEHILFIKMLYSLASDKIKQLDPGCAEYIDARYKLIIEGGIS